MLGAADWWRVVPGTRPIKVTIAKHDAGDPGRLQHVMIERDYALHSQAARRFAVDVERIIFVSDSLAWRIDEGDALRDDPYAGHCGCLVRESTTRAGV